MPEATILRFHHISPTVYMEYRSDDILVLRLADVSRHTVDSWMSVWQYQAAEAQKLNHPLRRLVHLQATPTPYAIACLVDHLSHSAPLAGEKFALLVEDPLSYQMFYDMLCRFAAFPHQAQVFTLEGEALYWLLA